MKLATLGISFRFVILGTAVGAFLAVAITGYATRIRPWQIVTVTFLTPPTSGIENEIEAAPSAPVEFQYRLTNQTNRTLREITPVLGCGCEMVGPFPTHLAPGDSATLTFRLRAPYVGQSAFRFPVTAEGYTRPIAAIEGTIRAVGQVPRVIAGSRYATAALIKGAGANPVAQIKTLEYRSSPPWGTDIRFESETELLPRLSLIAERREADPEICQRTYEVTLDGEDVPVGDYGGDLVISSNAAEELRRVALALHVLPRLALFPTLADGRSDVNSQVVRVVDRLRGGPVRVAEFDPSPFDIRELDLPGESAFEIASLDTDTAPAEVTFSTEDGGRQYVVVQLH